jgi:hypothetical protein
MATELDTAATVTPGVARIPATGRDPTEVFLGVRHRDYSEDDAQKKERNKKRRKTTNILDRDNIPNQNVLLPLPALFSFLNDNFICKSCRRNNHAEWELESIGLASSLMFRCSCGHSASVRADLKLGSEAKVADVDVGKAFSNKTNASDFEINNRFLLGLQLAGSGRKEAEIIPGLLNLSNGFMTKRYTDLQNDLGLSIIGLSNEILEENLRLEIEASPRVLNGRTGLSVSSDARWDKRGSGRRYDSLSGCSVMLGNRTKLVIAVEAMSQVCSKCRQGQQHEDSLCPKNYDGSSKGMEAEGAARIARRLFENYEVFIEEYVSDDDSSCRKILTHSFWDLIFAGRLTEALWPRSKSGRKKPNTGLLPVEHPNIVFLADKGHRVRSFARKHFALANENTKELKLGCTTVDAERIKRRLSWTLRLRTKGTYEEFRIAVLACLEHHFDNHDHCLEVWCPAKRATDDSREKHSLRLRCKTKNHEMYAKFKEYHEAFMDKDKLVQLFHGWDTNAVESFNKLLTKFLPKDRTYCNTIENKTRIHVALGLQSVGYRQFYKRLFERTGIQGDGHFTNLYVRAEDRMHAWKRLYQRLEAVKSRRMEKMYKKLREGRQKLISDNQRDLTYSSGMMMETEAEEGARSRKTRSTSGERRCPHCNEDSHQRRTSRLCPKNKKNLDRAEAASMRDAQKTREGKYDIREPYVLYNVVSRYASTHPALDSTGNGIQTGKTTSESERGMEGEDSFLGEIEEMNRFEEKELDEEDGVKYSNE